MTPLFSLVGLWYKGAALKKLSTLLPVLLLSCASSPTQPSEAAEPAPAPAGPVSPAAQRAAQADLQRAIRAARAGDDAATRRACEAAIQKDPQLERAYLLLGSSYALAGEGEAEAEVYARGLKALPRSSALYRERGLLYMRAGLYPEAVSSYEEARRLAEAEDPTLLADLAYAYLFVKRQEDAEALARRAYESAPKCFPCAMSYGQVKLSDKDFPAAIEAYERARQLQPGDVDARRSLGKALFLGGRAEEALKIYRALIEADPKDPRLNVQGAQVAMAASQPAEAARYLKRVAADNPGSAPLLTQLKAAQEAAGDDAGAKATAAQLERLKRDNP